MDTAPKYLTPKAAAPIYGVHADFFRKNMKEDRIVINRRTHLYPVAKLDKFFARNTVRTRCARKPKSTPTKS